MSPTPAETFRNELNRLTEDCPASPLKIDREDEGREALYILPEHLYQRLAADSEALEQLRAPTEDSAARDEAARAEKMRHLR